MPVTVDELRAVMRMELKPFMRDLQQLNGVNAKAARQLEDTWRAANRRLDGIGKNMARSLTAPLAGVGAIMGADQLRRMTDVWTDMTSRVNLAAGSVEKGTEVMGRLGEMARRTYSDLSQTAESYMANATALRELGYNTDETLDYTEALNNALVVSGAKGEVASRVIDALSKAMALGTLSGDNLNTVLASGGRVAEALAAGLGTTTNGLRKLGAQGKITGNDVVRALSSQMDTLRKEAEAMPATIGDGLTLLNNALLQYVGNADQATGVSASIAQALTIMADNFDKTADVVLQLASVIAGALIGRSLVKMISTLSLAGSALTNFTRAVAAARTMSGLATAIGGVGAAAGPVGMLIGGAVVGSLILYNNTIGASSEASQRFAERLKMVEEAARASGDAVEEAGQKNSSYNLNTMKEDVQETARQFDLAKDKVLELLDYLTQPTEISMVAPENIQKLKGLRDELSSNAGSAQDVKKQLQDLANLNPDFQVIADRLNPLLEKLMNISTVAKSVAGQLADGITSNGRFAKDDIVRVDLEKIAGDNYEKEALRKAALNKKEHSLEMERIKVRNDALKDGTKLTEESIDRIAKANLAANERWSEEGKQAKAPKKTEDDYLFQITQQVKDRTAAMAEEAKITGLTYLEQEKRRTALELEQDVLSRLREEARKKGDKDWENVSLSAQQVEAINAVSEAYAKQADELQKVQEAQSRAEQAAADFAETFKNGLVGAVTGTQKLKDAANMLLKKLGELITNAAFQQLLGGATKSGGWLTNFFGSLFGGGGFASGGYTGPGGKNQPAGIVHKGEVVFSQADVARMGGVAAVEALRRGYADGGPVGMRAPVMPKIARSSGREAITAPVSISIDATGADAAGLARVERQLASLKQELPGTIVKTVKDAQGRRGL